MSIATRITKIEARGGTGQIPIWCDDETGVPAAVCGCGAAVKVLGQQIRSLWQARV